MHNNFTNTYPGVQHYTLIDSTNAEAQRYLEKNNPKDLLWFLADEQEAGKGRMGSEWVSNKGNLFCSLIFPINWDLKLLPMLSGLVAVTIHETLSQFIGSSNLLKIKWPNDILINDSKISGALIENIINGTNKYTIIGIGINVISSPNLDIYKTSHINKHLENHTDVNEVFLKLKNNLENRLLIFSYKSAAIIREEMLKNAWKINEKINYISNSIEDSGIFENISDDYEIIIRTDTGLTKLNSGELKIIRN